MLNKQFKPIKPVLDTSNSLTNGLIFDAPMYEFDNTNTTIDRINTNTGTFNGTVKPSWTLSTLGAGLVFDGANAYIDYPDIATYDLTGTEISLESWFICTNTAVGGDIINKPHAIGAHTSPFFAYSLHLTNLGVRVWVTTTGNPGGISTTEVAVTQGALVHSIGTYKNGTGMIMYVNGVSVATNASANGSLTSFATQLRIGANGAPGEFFPGTVFTTRVWNRQLSSTEVTSLFSDPFGIYVRKSFSQNPLRPRPFAPGVAR